MSAVEQVHIWAWVLYACGLGAVVGFERDWRGHEAGLRTAALVCGGAALFGFVSNSYGDSRVAAGVVQGIGFICAGLVFRRDRTVKGATTAATVWAEAAIGLMVAQRLWVAAGLVTFTLVVFLELAPLSRLVVEAGERRRSLGAGPGNDD